MKINKDKAALLVVDMQPKVLELIPDHATTLKNCQWLVDLCRDLAVPVQFSAHYPRGIGPVSPVLLERIEAPVVTEKSFFSCVEGACLEGSAVLEREQTIVCGIEAHACVMLTALDLAAAGKQVFVVVDAIAARSEVDKSTALQRMVAAGIVPVTREMAFFELLRQAGTPEFKAYSKKYLQ
jgi:nicotinamidase-related amidase